MVPCTHTWLEPGAPTGHEGRARKRYVLDTRLLSSIDQARAWWKWTCGCGTLLGTDPAHHVVPVAGPPEVSARHAHVMDALMATRPVDPKWLTTIVISLLLFHAECFSPGEVGYMHVHIAPAQLVPFLRHSVPIRAN